MISRMTKYSFILMNGEKEGFLECLRGLGVVDITRSGKPVDAASEKMMAEIEETGRRIAEIRKGSDAQLTSLIEDRDSVRAGLEGLRPWGEFDMPTLRALGDAGVEMHFYRVPAKRFDPAWAERYALEVIDGEGSEIFFVIAGDNDGFPLVETAPPLASFPEKEAELKAKEEAVEEYVRHLESLRDGIPAMESHIASLRSDLSLYLAGLTGEEAVGSAVTIYEGFAPVEEDAALSKAFDEAGIFWMAEEARTEDKPPIKLKNNRFIRQFEVLTGMYGMPVYNEFDPTIFLSIFFLLFFAMCMGDAGYGLLLVITGFALKGREGSLARLWSLIVTLGAGTIAVGLVMGGFFGMDLYEASWVPDGMKRFMLTGEIVLGDSGMQWVRGQENIAAIPSGASHYSIQMVLSLLIGILHISLAMVMKAVWSIRKEGLKNSLSALGWTLLIVGGVILAAVAMLGNLPETTIKVAVIALAVLSALGIFFFNKWGRNPLLNIGSGLWDTYSMASGLMGDVLSYIRLYALGLSGGMLGSTFNLIAEMVKGSDPTWQWVPFVLIIIVGHALNLAMSCLGAFVHPLRLNFVEFFKNSNYEGRGKQYNPITK